MSEIIVSERESVFISDETCSAIVSGRENGKQRERKKERGIVVEKKRVNGFWGEEDLFL